VSRWLENAGVIAKKERANLKAGEPGDKAKKRAEEKAKKAAAAAEKPAETPAEAAAE